MDSVWLSFGSLVFGLAAWIFPVVNFGRYEKHNHWITRSIISLSACAMSLAFVILYIHHLVKIEDWSSLMDTMGAFAFVSIVLFAVTAILNIINLIIHSERIAN
ncbi:hypothetical protein [Planococcus sp. CAU13]|uniref:hypothetical protein n=1 Tax=Planococcus sp. CAU13 TaxID=1541197 RepID=UPI00052FEAC8|nr:hypothetical protein [Planococcus sp. CAU13]